MFTEGGSESESDEDVQEENKDGEREEGEKKKPKKDTTVNRYNIVSTVFCNNILALGVGRRAERSYPPFHHLCLYIPLPHRSDTTVRIMSYVLFLWLKI